jgi:hypothetical protein
VIEEVPSAAASSVGVLAKCPVSNSERDVHKVAKGYKLTVPIALTPVQISKATEIPVLLLSSWFKYIMSLNLWHTLSGLQEPDDVRCKAQWSLFWSRFRKIMPNHDIFNLERAGVVKLERTCAVVLHGDEGRTKKKSAIMVLNVSSLLGFGSNVKNRRASLETDYAKQDINFTGNTWATRWLLGVMPKGLYDPKKGDAEAFDRMSQALVDDMNQLIQTGALSVKGEKHWLVVLYVTGDWPFHQKSFHLGRTFGSVAKQPSSKTVPKGICHNCCADQDGYPFEDFESPEPRWRTTVGLDPPFLQDPVFLQLPHDQAMPTSMIGLDLFHGFHLGAGKVFCSSVLVLVSEILEGSSVPKRFESLHDLFFRWCQLRNQHPYIKKLSQETVKWIQTTDFPSGAWSKGSTTLCLLRFIIETCRERENEIEDTLLHTCYIAAVEIDSFFSKIYKEGVWIPGDKAREIAAHGFAFLKFNGRAARAAFEENRALLPFMPNLHRLHEIFFLMVDQVKTAGFCLSPLVWSCQLAEDYIGKPSRLSRRVSTQLAVTRTLQRSLEATHVHFRDAGYIR